MNITLWVLQSIMALGFALNGLMKLSGSPQGVVIFEAMGTLAGCLTSSACWRSSERSAC